MTLLNSRFSASILTLLFSIGANPGFGAEATTKKRYRVQPVTHMEDGAMGVKKLYYKQACDETAEQLLTESLQDNQINVAVLVSVSPSPCSGPDRTRMIRFVPGRNSLEFVTGFDEVWHCFGYCHRPNQPGEPPQNIRVYSYGTSHEQAFDNIACNGYPASVQCHEIEIGAY
jgi:hypothetical protein